MNRAAEHSHTVTALVDVEARTAFAFMADPVALGGWALGCMQTEPSGGSGLYVGRSLFDGGQGWLEIDARPELLLIDYHIGTPEMRVPRISARIVSAAVCDLQSDQCYVTLTAWRPSGMADDRWRRLCASHEAEIWLIKSQIETRHRTA